MIYFYLLKYEIFGKPFKPGIGISWWLELCVTADVRFVHDLDIFFTISPCTSSDGDKNVWWSLYVVPIYFHQFVFQLEGGLMSTSLDYLKIQMTMLSFCLWIFQVFTCHGKFLATVSVDLKWTPAVSKNRLNISRAVLCQSSRCDQSIAKQKYTAMAPTLREEITIMFKEEKPV